MLIAWIFFSVIVGAIGDSKKIGFVGATLLSLMLSPIIGLIFVLISERKNSPDRVIGDPEEIKRLKDRLDAMEFEREQNKKNGGTNV